MVASAMAAAAALCREDARREEEKYGHMRPCRKLSPLSPPLKLEEYFMLERDNGKYMLYWVAIQMAFQSMVESSIPIKKRGSCIYIRCIVVGPGLGRLVRFCLDAAKEKDIEVSIHAVEANPVAVEFLKKEFEAYKDTVIIHGPLALHPAFIESDLPDGLSCLCHQFDFAVSELLGTFGDDEFLPELTLTIQRLFLKLDGGIMMPRNWTTYVAPIHSPQTREFLMKHMKSLEACYVMGLPTDCVILAKEEEMWNGQCSEVSAIELNGRCQFSITKTSLVDSNHSVEQVGIDEESRLSVDGFVGYFTSELWPGIVIDTRHMSHQRNCFHWESHFFPLKFPIDLHKLNQKTTLVDFSLTRKCVSIKSNNCGSNRFARRSKLRLWYEWQVEQQEEKQLHNSGGHTDMVCLSWPAMTKFGTTTRAIENEKKAKVCKY